MIAVSAVVDTYGIRVTFGDAELYFDSRHGGEISEYYDLGVDPLRQRNLADLSIPGNLQEDLWPLFTSAIYNPYTAVDYSSGGYHSATVSLVSDDSTYLVLRSTSKMWSYDHKEVRNASGEPAYIRTTWRFNKQNGLIFVEREFRIATSLYLSSGWRWYPFYLTRVSGFPGTGTFRFFNTSSCSAVLAGKDDYQNKYSVYPVFPSDSAGVFGMAAPFSDPLAGGDGSQSIVVVYRYSDFKPTVSEWKSDLSNNVSGWGIAWDGPVHEYGSPVNLTTHVFRAMIHFTRDTVPCVSLPAYASYAAGVWG